MSDTQKGYGFRTGVYLSGIIMAFLAFEHKNFSSDVNVHTYPTPEPLFQDINGDGRKDMVYGVEIEILTKEGYLKSREYSACFRLNDGNTGFFAEVCPLRTKERSNLQILYQREERRSD